MNGHLKKAATMIDNPIVGSVNPKSFQSSTATIKEVNYPGHYRGETLLKIPRRDRINSRLVCLLTPASIEAESYYRLRHVIEDQQRKESGSVIGVTSALAGDGKSLTAINLAGALAQDKAASVLLIDLDLRQPGTSIREYLNLPALDGPGISEWILDPELGNVEITHYLADFNLYLVTAGAAVASPYELLNATRLDTFLTQARERYDYVILDTAQVLHLPDTQLISRLVDGFLFVIRADHTQSRMVEDSLNLLEQDKVIGLVFNGNSSPR
jgi:protein-tyrosine kinase